MSQFMWNLGIDIIYDKSWQFLFVYIHPFADNDNSLIGNTTPEKGEIVMQLSVSGDRVDVGPHLREYIDRQLYFALGRFSPAIDRVDVRLADIDGPRGGVDKRCRIVVKLRAAGSTSITIDDDDANLHVAIANATARIGRTVARAEDRKRGKFAYQRRRAIAEDVHAIADDVESDA